MIANARIPERTADQPVDATEAIATAEAALRQLLGTIAPAPDDARDDEVVLDAAVDGYRCIVVRAAVNEHPSRQELSPREQEIARMVAEGHTNKMIARVLEISIWTVSSHLRRAFSKMDVTSRAALVAKLANDRDRIATTPHRDARRPTLDPAESPALLDPPRAQKRIS